MKSFFKLLISSDNRVSSKRVCGILGFLSILCVLLYCNFKQIEAPKMLDTFIWADCALLGIDSVTNIWKTKS